MLTVAAGFANVVQQHNRRLLADRAVGALFVVVLAPILQLFLRVCKAEEPMRVQTLGSEATVEHFVERDVALVSPQIQRVCQ